MNLPATSKIPLAKAADDLAIIHRAIDEGNLDETITALFNETRLDLSAAVDRRICFFGVLESNISKAKEIRDAWKQRVVELEYALSKLEDRTLNIIETTPDVKFKGEIGILRAQNSPAHLELKFATTNKTLANTIGDEVLDLFAVDEKYYTEYSTKVLDTKKIRDDLAAGVELPWAELKRDKHLRWKYE